jgi:hypothetical protein
MSTSTFSRYTHQHDGPTPPTKPPSDSGSETEDDSQALSPTLVTVPTSSLLHLRGAQWASDCDLGMGPEQNEEAASEACEDKDEVSGGQTG